MSPGNAPATLCVSNRSDAVTFEALPQFASLSAAYESFEDILFKILQIADGCLGRVPVL
ncbi:MAG: hypothetical protein Fues2KO_54070 [Fuerstiella sp.]